jgi:hypothetical protein
MIVPASILTVTVVEEGIAVSVNEGIVNIFGCQSSRKNPMVLAVAGSTGFGSTGGVTGIESWGGVGGAGSPGFFFQEN